MPNPDSLKTVVREARDAYSPPDYCPLHAYPAFALYSPLKRNQNNTLITHFDPDAVFLLLENAERVLKNVKASNFGGDSDDFRDSLRYVVGIVDWFNLYHNLVPKCMVIGIELA